VAGMKGKSGPPGNQNAFQHGLSAVDQRRTNGALTPDEQSIREEILTGLIQDKGGEARACNPSPTVSKKRDRTAEGYWLTASQNRPATATARRSFSEWHRAGAHYRELEAEIIDSKACSPGCEWRVR
jgi:hypothetical protein